jgi:BirA family biotin operon repressor/biotin-[acetyl-CoA-carboxylase] ligase
LKPGPKSLNLYSILKGLHTHQFGRTLQILDTCTSTNDIAAELACSGASHGYVVLAEEQTAGRGRLGRAWLSPRGGIWMTLVLRPPFDIRSLIALPLAGALAIARSINSSLSAKARVRWPNDVTLESRKIAGTLAESQYNGGELQYALLGIGIDANLESVTLEGVRGTTTTLLDELGFPVDREALICALLQELERIYDMATGSREEELMILLREMDCSRGRLVRIGIGHEKIVGTFDGYDSASSVRVATAKGLVRLETSLVEDVEYSYSLGVH